MGEYAGDVGEYAGLVGEYAGEVGEYAGLVGLYAGLVGEYAGLVGEYPATKNIQRHLEHHSLPNAVTLTGLLCCSLTQKARLTPPTIWQQADDVRMCAAATSCSAVCKDMAAGCHAISVSWKVQKGPTRRCGRVGWACGAVAWGCGAVARAGRAVAGRSGRVPRRCGRVASPRRGGARGEHAVAHGREERAAHHGRHHVGRHELCAQHLATSMISLCLAYKTLTDSSARHTAARP